MTRRLFFELRGIPVPYSLRGGGNIHTTPALKSWKARVREAAEQAIDAAKWAPMPGAVFLRTRFFLLRRGRPKKGDAERYHMQKPDTEALLRPVKDALTDAGVWRLDDSQVVRDDVAKRWAIRGAERGSQYGFVGVQVWVCSISDSDL